jgi:hypothetical protein
MQLVLWESMSAESPWFHLLFLLLFAQFARQSYTKNGKNWVLLLTKAGELKVHYTTAAASP